MSCFAAVLLVGAIAGQGVAHLIVMGLVVLMIAYGAGMVIGSLIQRALLASVAAYEAAHPFPQLNDEEISLTEAPIDSDNESAGSMDRRKAA